jgi:hypothetical protein
MLENTFAYFERGLGIENKPIKGAAGLTMIAGAVLWVATVGISAYLADREEGNTRTNYTIVAILTGITGVTTFLDFEFKAKKITMFTIAMGSIATFTSAGKLITVTDQNTKTNPDPRHVVSRSRRSAPVDPSLCSVDRKRNHACHDL